MSESWRPIPDAPDYEVSDLGRVRSYRSWKRGASNGRVLRPKVGYGGYAAVLIRLHNGRAVERRVHVLVMAAFAGPRPDGMVTRHLNGVPSDNRLTNLAYGTPSENGLDTVAHGRNPWRARTECGYGHPFDAENTGHTPKGVRFCRTCRRIKNKQLSERRSAERAKRREQVRS